MPRAPFALNLLPVLICIASISFDTPVVFYMRDLGCKKCNWGLFLLKIHPWRAPVFPCEIQTESNISLKLPSGVLWDSCGTYIRCKVVQAVYFACYTVPKMAISFKNTKIALFFIRAHIAQNRLNCTRNYPWVLYFSWKVLYRPKYWALKAFFDILHILVSCLIGDTVLKYFNTFMIRRLLLWLPYVPTWGHNSTLFVKLNPGDRWYLWKK